jgi:hypothetical protein
VDSSYVETFDDGPGGWLAWDGESTQPMIEDGALVARSPWWVDYNHAPPGGGYLHLLGALHTHPSFVTEKTREVAGVNRFVAGGYSRDLTNARVTVRLRGEVELRGAELVLLAQADIPGTRANYVLTGQPLAITAEWSEQTITLAPDAEQWVCLGSRHDRTQLYGCGEIEQVLKDLNCDIILVLFPLTVESREPVADLHRLRAGVDYEVDYERLPRGWVAFDTVRIEYVDGAVDEKAS